MSQIASKFLSTDSVTAPKIAADAVTGSEIRLANNEFIRARNQANSADLNLLKLDTSNRLQLGDSTTLPLVLGTQLSSNPTGVTAGLFYNTTSNDMRYYNGTAWFALAKDDLSNLASVTAVSQDLIFSSTKSIRVANDVALRGRNQFNSADIDMIKVGTSGQIVIGNATNNFSSGSLIPTAHNTYTCGSAVFYWSNMYTVAMAIGAGTMGNQTSPSGNAGVVSLASSTVSDAGVWSANNANNDAVATRILFLETGNKSNASASGNSGEIRLRTGDVAGSGNSGDLTLTTGTVNTGARGRVVVTARTFRLPRLAAAPTATESGEMYYDTTTNKSYTWDGSTWQAHF